MIKRVLIIALFFNYVSQAQTGNYTAGSSVTPNSNDPAPYNGTLTIGTTGGNISTGDYNTYVGDGAGSEETSGDRNVFIGTATGALLPENADENVIIGAFAADQTSFSSFDENVIIGSRAARTLEGDDNVVIGKQAGTVMTTAFYNVIIGEQAGYALTGGDRNVFIGHQSGKSTTIGVNNIFIGENTGLFNTTGASNVFIGGEPGASLDNSTYDYIYGAAGLDNTTGTNNTFIGSGAGTDTSDGAENTFIGGQAGTRNEHGNFNTFIGYQAGARNNINNSSGNAMNNTFVGWRAGLLNDRGMNNVVMGADAGFESSTETNNSVIIGYLAKINGATDRNNNVLLGANAITTNSNVLALGANTNVTGSYSAAIGTGAVATANNSMVFGGTTTTNRVSVGIATATPNQNASLDLADTDKGLLLNRVTNAERTAMITTPASGVALTTTDAGLMVYDTDDHLFYFWNGTQWSELGKTVGSGTSAVPDLLNYQSAVRDASGDMLVNQAVSFRMSVIDVSSGSSTVYSETHNVTTSNSGMINFQIGNGTIVSGLFANIDWSHNNSLQIELDATGGTTYASLGTMSFVSVPYALRARYAENLTSSANAKMSNKKDEEIKTLEAKVLKLEKLVNQLINK